MRKNYSILNKAAGLALAATMILGFTSCDDILGEWDKPTPAAVTPSSEPSEPSATAVTGITLNKTALTMNVGDADEQLSATVEPADATSKTVTWNSDKPGVATVADGVVHAVAAGTANITATANDGSGVTATCVVMVEGLLTTITAVGTSNVSSATSANVSYSTEGVATLSFSGSVSYNSSANWGWWGYGWSATVNAAEGYTITKCIFYDDANRTATDSEAPFVVETTVGDKTPKVNGTPILADTSKGITKIEVFGY